MDFSVFFKLLDSVFQGSGSLVLGWIRILWFLWFWIWFFSGFGSFDSSGLGLVFFGSGFWFFGYCRLTIQRCYADSAGHNLFDNWYSFADFWEDFAGEVLGEAYTILNLRMTSDLNALLIGTSRPEINRELSLILSIFCILTI